MSIKEVEEKTGLARSNIRFYEKEKLIQPDRNESNGYREYSEQNVEDIKKIAYLRTLGVTIESIKKIINHEVSLQSILEKQAEALDAQTADLEKAKAICNAMLSAGNVTYDDLEVGAYVPEFPAYWNTYRKVLKLDSVNFLYIWGGFAMWGLITTVSLFVALLTYSSLPEEIPVQWSNGAVSSSVSKIFIFAYPAACILLRILIRPLLYRRLQKGTLLYHDILAAYLTNFLCFVALSIEAFSVLYVYGIVEHVTTLLLADAIIFIGVLISGTIKLSRGTNQN